VCVCVCVCVCGVLPVYNSRHIIALNLDDRWVHIN